MTRNQVREIGRERLSRWLCKLVDSHSTPFLLVGVGHDGNSGGCVICACEDTDDAELLLMLRGVVRLLEERLGAQ